MSKYQQFIFKNYRFDQQSKTLELEYSLDEKLDFTERFVFDFDFVDYDEIALDRTIQNLFFLAGVSYYKTYLPPEIIIRKGEIDQKAADFYGITYRRGLGEFFYVNKLDPHTEVKFPVSFKQSAKVETAGLAGKLAAIGGGKDSLVSVEVLRGEPDLATWSVGSQPQLKPLVEKIGLPHYWVERTWDRKLIKLNEQGALNGHVPISAIYAATGLVVAILSGKRDIVVSNESSASDPNLTYQGVAINHQYSKSLEFEQDFQSLLEHQFTNGPRYYSLLRPYTELRISEFFAKNGFRKYKAVFSSCNRAFRQDSDHLFWCGECPKCAFVFLALTPFVDRTELESLWGENLLLKPSLEPTYRKILGIDGHKPLDCVGEVEEARSAMDLAKKIYPELVEKYSYDIPVNYDYHQVSPHSMPQEVYKDVVKALEKL